MGIQTTIEFHARTYSSAAELFAEAQARKKRMQQAAKAKASQREAVAETKAIAAPAIAKPVKIKEREWFVQQDWHIQEFYKYLSEVGSPRKAYIKRRSSEFGTTYAEIIGPSRYRGLAWARSAIMAELQFLFEMSLPEIGRMFGGRDHTTVLHGIRSHQQRVMRFGDKDDWIKDALAGKHNKTIMNKNEKITHRPPPYPGVHWNGQNRKWVVTGYRDGIRYHLGTFEDDKDAIAARIRFDGGEHGKTG